MRARRKIATCNYDFVAVAPGSDQFLAGRLDTKDAKQFGLHVNTVSCANKAKSGLAEQLLQMRNDALTGLAIPQGGNATLLPLPRKKFFKGRRERGGVNTQ